ncbi:MAG: DUF2723 domain-containing protein [Bacteroidetes bacterium]|nr:DUF2723 domain-containing protein [Bacteroidota bacterium]
MNFKRLNNIVGWIVCVIACTTYVMTMEASGSFWDCGEFVSSAYKLQIPHPPGAPLFVLMGRFFIILFGDNPQTAARGVNFMSALASGFTILFLFWSITHFARKVVQKGSDVLTNQQLFTIMSAGVVGALCYTFSDSFWYSAVEGEVYGSSSFFTALVFWAILKWEHEADNPTADRWLIFIFYMMGLSIGVHLLNLLTIPAIVIVYYFRRYKATTWGTIFAFIIGCAITGVVQKFVIQYTIKGAAWMDIKFVNGIGLPFFTGFAFFFVLIAALVIFGIRYAVKRKYYYLKLGIWSFAFMLLGYSTYFTTIIRSNANPAVDMFNVDNPVSLVGYLSREQYGDWPIMYGPDFTERPPTAEGSDMYVRGKDKYELAGKTRSQDWAGATGAHFFPRMWDNSNDRGQADAYRIYGGMSEGDVPTMANNIKYFMGYQVWEMYLRYFCWNFTGKQNDLQGFGNPRDGNAITGIPFIDNFFLGDQSKMPDSIHINNKAYNRFYMLPLILGLIGLYWQYMRNRKDFVVTMLLFLFTGMAVVFYLNQAGYQPRERDYAYVGSFYAFAIWVGLGVVQVKQWFEKFIKGPVANYAAAGLCVLAVPVLMGAQEWDDHDRSKKVLARDLAKNYLESCPPNAILFSFGDNDTYPLWYAQEVEGIRPDVRVVVNSLLGTDWYMNQLRYKVNQSAPFDIIFTPEQIQGNKRDAIYYNALPGFDQNKYYDLYALLKDVIGSDDPKFTVQQDDEVINLFPVRKFSVPVDIAKVTKDGLIKDGDSVVKELQIDLPQRNYLLKNDLAIFAVIAANKWNRPVCFTSTQELNDLGLAKYVQLSGLSYQLIPTIGRNVNNDAAYNTIMQKFAYGNADKQGVYYDEENRRHLNTMRLAHAEVALSLISEGKKDSAKQILEHWDKNVKESNFPYGMTTNRGNQQNGISTEFLQACYAAGDTNLARKVETSLKKDLHQQMRYYKALGDEQNITDDLLANNAYQYLQGKGGSLGDKQYQFAQDIVLSYRMLMQIDEMDKQYNHPIIPTAESLQKIINNAPAAKKDSPKGKK